MYNIPKNYIHYEQKMFFKTSSLSPGNFISIPLLGAKKQILKKDPIFTPSEVN